MADGGKSTYLADALLDHHLGGPDYTRPATVYIGLFTTLPAIGGVGGVEPSTGGYARVAVTNDSTNFPASSGGIKRNGTAIAWSAFSAAIGTVTGAGIWDSPSGGNMLRWGPLGTSRTLASGEGFEIPANGGTFTEI